MKILFVGNWSLDEGLTQATVLPHLEILLRSPKLELLVFCSIERDGIRPEKPDYFSDPRIVFAPLVSKKHANGLMNKISDLINFPATIKKLIQEYQIDQVIARGSPAGGLVYRICNKLGIPYYVESFEPHADYMYESGVWKRWDPKYIVQNIWEREMKKSAAGLIPVAERYKNQLVKEGVPAKKIAVVPCSVDFKKFGYDPEMRRQIRERLQIPQDAYVGIYLGKYGGNYFNEEAFLLYKRIMDASDTWILIVSPDPAAEIERKIEKFQLPKNRIRFTNARHHEVSGFLSAADFGFATVLPSPSKNYVSLIKLGEYWACGLPILITENIGDDSDFIKDHKIGFVLTEDWKEKPDAFFSDMIRQLKSINEKPQIRMYAQQRRSLENSENAYRYFGLI